MSLKKILSYPFCHFLKRSDADRISGERVKPGKGKHGPQVFVSLSSELVLLYLGGTKLLS